MDTSSSGHALIPTTTATTLQQRTKLLVACPCLNVKLHLAQALSDQDGATSIAGKETKLGLAGVSVEQKILCSLAISAEVATVKCLNCDRDVYTFQPSSSSVRLESTPLAFLSSSAFSPSDGVVIPSEAVITGQQIDALVNDANYSKAFRLVLTLAAASSSTSTTPSAHTASTSQQPPLEQPYRPELDKVRSILERELEANLNAQRQQTEARIEAYKSQQLIALEKSIERTKKEKDSLWLKIQEQVTSPPATVPSTPGGTGELRSGGAADMNGQQHPFDMVPSTLPVRFTNAAGLYGSFIDRRKAGESDAAMSLQFREFDQRMASNSMRRQSLVPAQAAADAAAAAAAAAVAAAAAAAAAVVEATSSSAMDDAETEDVTLSNTVANAASAFVAEEPSSSSALNSGTSSPTEKSKKKVTISDAIKRVSIVEPENNEDAEVDDAEDNDDEELEEDGVVFDMDEELFDDEGQQQKVGGYQDNQDDDDIGMESHDDTGPFSNSNGIAIASSVNRSMPKKSGMVVGSLRVNYLRRQKELEQHRKQQEEEDDDLDFDVDDDDDDDDDDSTHTNTLNPSAAVLLSSSLPIRILPRPNNPPPPPPTRGPAVANSLALPPGTTPAAAMLQRRLSRAYGDDLAGFADNTNIARSLNTAFAGPHAEAGTSLVLPVPTAPGTVIIDPLMLLEEEHDEDVREDRFGRRRQSFSSINHRRDLERIQQMQQQQSYTIQHHQDSVDPMGVNHHHHGDGKSSTDDFEPPHLYSARTYVGSTPWEMPTRITVKSGGMQREGSHLDKQIALEMAKEMEKERLEKEQLEKEKDTTALAADSSPITHRVVDKIDEAEEEVDEEDLAKQQQQLQLPSTAPPSQKQQQQQQKQQS